MKQQQSPSPLLRLVLCILIVGMGFGGFMILKKMKKPPRRVEASEQALPVQAVRVKPGRVAVIVSGYGEIRSRSTVPLSAEVAGRISSTHANLEVGAVINQGDILFMINDEDYRLELTTARARQKSLSRDLELSRRELVRVSDLYSQKKVGTQSSVEKAEQAVNSILNQLSQVEQSLELARLRVERCTIKAPFSGRITELNVEKDEYVTPGRKLLTMVDDRDLELQVPLDSRDVVNRLRFQPRSDTGSWFGLPEKTDCEITWTENRQARGKGTLDRVVRFDPQTRTLVMAVRLLLKNSAPVPLVEGMFCRVDIHAQPLDNVMTLPRRAVTFDGRVYLVHDNRLQSRKVTVAREQDDKALIIDGLQDGEMVITTRLENPLENSLVRVEELKESGQ